MLDSNDRPRRRMALIDLELGKVNVGIAALQEVRLSGEGHQREAGRSFYWKYVQMANQDELDSLLPLKTTWPGI